MAVFKSAKVNDPNEVELDPAEAVMAPVKAARVILLTMGQVLT